MKRKIIGFCVALFSLSLLVTLLNLPNGADLTGKDLTGANLEGARRIDKAVFNNTTMPDGTTRKTSSGIIDKISEYCKIWISTNSEPD